LGEEVGEEEVQHGPRRGDAGARQVAVQLENIERIDEVIVGFLL
jgi:hypothetical protein